MKKHRVAILGFGVVGGGVADLLTKNREQIKEYLGCEVEIGAILDRRDFPDSPLADLITKNFDDIRGDESIDTVIEVMGGSHPAYEYTVGALRAKKSVISSNKEVIANYGDEFIALAKQNGVSYRFEAAVGGGIPIINPLISCLRQNRITEVRGILNGTTNYILTQMLDCGESFADALKGAQEKGYAESNPSADIEGTDAARKITILTALATGILPDVSTVYTEGITAIRAQDVRAAQTIGHTVKLLGRCIIKDGVTTVMVAPFMLPSSSPLSGVNGVYNAVEVTGEPLGNIMLYGQGAGGGATASAVVGDLLPIISQGGADTLTPIFKRSSVSCKETFKDFVSRSYIALPLGSTDKVYEVFGQVTYLDTEGECAFITPAMSESELDERIKQVCRPVLSRIRLL